jgi:predicted NAD/FAD-binding protein
MNKTRIAVIGAGIAGLAAAWRLQQGGKHTVTLFEAGSYFGGHTHTVDVTLPNAVGHPVTYGVDTGFLVYNHRTYPGLVALFEALGVPTAASEMSFSVQSRQGLVWSGRNLNGVFAQRRNLLRPRFWHMLREVQRFNRLATAMACSGQDTALALSVGQFLDHNGFGAAFRDGYFLPMVACIWSCPTEQMLAFPMATMVRFCNNHGLLQVSDHPPWYTVQGGARHYVTRMLRSLPDTRLNTPVHRVDRQTDGVRVHAGPTTNPVETFDAVVFACHSDQTLRLLGAGATAQERSVLGAIAYHPNRAVLHTDTSLLPPQRRAWAAWNYEQAPQAQADRQAVCLHYWLNRLQPLPFATDVVVSLNPVREPAPHLVIAEFDYSHPVFDRAAIEAQARVPQLQGHQRSWFCGAWTGYGFHEDGLRSGLAVAAGLETHTACAEALPVYQSAHAA